MELLLELTAFILTVIYMIQRGIKLYWLNKARKEFVITLTDVIEADRRRTRAGVYEVRP